MYLVKHSHTINYQGFWLIYVEFDWPIRLIFVWTSKLLYVINYLRFIFTPPNRISIWFEKWSANGRIQHFPNSDWGPPPVLYVKWPRIWITKIFLLEAESLYHQFAFVLQRAEISKFSVFLLSSCPTYILSLVFLRRQILHASSFQCYMFR